MMRDKVRKRVRAKNIQKHRKKNADEELIKFHSELAEQVREERKKPRPKAIPKDKRKHRHTGPHEGCSCKYCNPSGTAN